MLRRIIPLLAAAPLCIAPALADGGQKKTTPQQQRAARRAVHGAPHFPVHLSAVPLKAAAAFLSEKAGYPILIKGLDLKWPVTLKRGEAPLFSHLLALSTEARASFKIDPRGRILLSKGPLPSSPRLIEGPFLAEVLYVERVARYAFKGQPSVLARAAVRLTWEPDLRLTGHRGRTSMVPNLGPGTVTRVITIEVDRKAETVTIPAQFKVELSPTLQTTSAKVGRGASGLDPLGGDPELGLSLRSTSASKTKLEIRFELKGIAQAARDRAVQFRLEGADGTRLAPDRRRVGGKLGQRTCKLSFKFDKSFAPARLLILYPRAVIEKTLNFTFKDVRLPR